MILFENSMSLPFSTAVASDRRALVNFLFRLALFYAILLLVEYTLIFRAISKARPISLDDATGEEYVY
jgi:hypothetical protein